VPRPATATSWSAPGSPSETDGSCWCWTRPACRPGAWTTCPGSTRRWRPRCSSPPRAGDRVDVVAGDRRIRTRLRLAGARDATSRLEDAFAGLHAEIAEADWTALAGAVQSFGRQRALVCLLTPLEPSAVEEGLLPVLPVLVAHHRVVLASVRDPELERLAEARAGLDEVYAAAAAEQTLARRRATADLLETLGVHVLDAPADELPPALADHYLSLKAAGLL
jgi:uncharacterized protein (DUF58 family)